MHAEAIARIKREWDEEVLRVQRQEHPGEFPALPEVPAGRYSREDFYQLEQERLWPRTWLLAGHTSELPEIGSYKLWDAAGMPVILVRGKNEVIRAFFNVCQHRGAAVAIEPTGTRKALTCVYHSWTYGLDGALNYVTDEYDFAGLDKSRKGLKPLRCEQWGSLIFVNADLDAMPLREHLGGIYDHLEDMRFDEVTMFAKLTYDIPCNWKGVQDAFSEGYHINTVHKNTVALFLQQEVGTRRLFPHGHGYQIVRQNSGEAYEEAKYFDRFAMDMAPEHEITRNASRAYSIFPNAVIPVTTTQFPVIVAWPRGPNHCFVEVYYLATPGHGDPESDACKTVIQMFEVVTQEDLGVLTAQQKGLRSGAVAGISLNYLERLIYNHHEQLDRVLGLERVPVELRVPQILGPFIEP